MKSFFSGLKLGAPSTAQQQGPGAATQASAKRASSQGDQQMPEMLGKAESLLQKLRSSRSHDFPLLNECTRLVQLLEGSVTKMPDNDVKGVWREQVNELQRSLQSATEKMLSAEMQPAAAAAANKAPQGRSKAPRAKAATPEKQAETSGGYEAPVMLAGADMFSGLDLPGFATEPEPEPPAPAPVAPRTASTSASAAPPLAERHTPAPHETTHGRTSSSGALPLPADLFTGLDHLSIQSPAQPDPFAAPPLSAPVSTPAAAPISTAAMQHQAPSPRAQVAGSAPQVVTTAPDGRRKKKSTRRVGYARDEVAEAPVRPASPALPAATAATPSTSHAPAHAPPPPQTLTPQQAPAQGAPAAPLAATHTTAALLDLVSESTSVEPASSQLPPPPPPPTPITTAGHSQAGQDSKHASPRHRPPHTDAPPCRGTAAAAAATAAPIPPVRGSSHAAAKPSAPPATAALPLSTLSALLPVAAPAMSAQDIRQAEAAVAMSPKAFMQVAKGQAYREGLQALQQRAELEITALADSIAAAVNKEQAARNKRHTFTSEAAADAGQMRQLEEAEQLAVEQEDFEAAANLSTELDALRAHSQALDRSARAAEAECEAAVAQRTKLALRQVALWQAAAQATALLQAAQEQAAAKAAQQTEAEANKLTEAIAASEERVEELKARIAARQEWIDKEQASVDAKIEEATRPVAAERAQAAEAHTSLQEEVEELRRQLQQKEEALAAASVKLAGIDQHMHSLAAKYDKTLARLAEDRKAVTNEEAERDAEEAAVASSRAQAAEAQAAAEIQQSKSDDEVAAAASQSSEMLSRAAAISAAVEAEARVQQVQAGLRDQEEQAHAAVKELEDRVEGSRVGVRGLGNHRAALANEAAAAEAQAAAARRRIPELEADKKTAAAARDFKGAAALASEAKALATQANNATSMAQKLRQQVGEAEEQERDKLDVIRQQEVALAAAKTKAALAKWRRLQANLQGLAQQIEQAAAADKYEEATALQAELDRGSIEAAALASEHGFSSQEAHDLLPASVPAATTAATKPAASPRVNTRSAKPRANQPVRRDTDLPAPILPDQLIGNGRIPASKAQTGSTGLSAAALGQQEEEDGDSVEVDQDGMLVGDSSSVISASHAATDGSRSVQSSRTVLDKMPEFNMDDAVSFRSVSSSRSASQPTYADARSVRALSTRDDADKADEADETSSFRSMSSTTSTNYTTQRVRQTGRPLYTIPDEAAGDDGNEDDADDDDAESSSTGHSEGAATDDAPFSAAAQALHHEADALVSISHHASDAAESLPELGMDKEARPSSSKSMGSLGSLSGGLSPVSETRSAGQDARQDACHDDDDDDDAEEGREGSLVTDSTASTSAVQGPAASQHGRHVNAELEQIPATLLSSSVQAGAESVVEPAGLEQRLGSQASLDSESLHTPRAMPPPSTPGAPVLPKIDAGPNAIPPLDLQGLQPPTENDSLDDSASDGNTMFAGLDMMS